MGCDVKNLASAASAAGVVPTCHPHRGFSNRPLSSVNEVWPGGRFGVRSHGALVTPQVEPGGAGSATQGPGIGPLQVACPLTSGQPGVGDCVVHARVVVPALHGSLISQQNFQSRLLVTQVLVSSLIGDEKRCVAVNVPVERLMLTLIVIGEEPNVANGLSEIVSGTMTVV